MPSPVYAYSHLRTNGYSRYRVSNIVTGSGLCLNNHLNGRLQPSRFSRILFYVTAGYGCHSLAGYGCHGLAGYGCHGFNHLNGRLQPSQFSRITAAMVVTV